jgi:hypothetical protein
MTHIDRRTFLGSLRENGGTPRRRPATGHFLRSGLSAKVAELRRFLVIFRGMQPSFSTSQTTWRRDPDSNPRYRSETCKRRHPRKLQEAAGKLLARAELNSENQSLCNQGASGATRLRRRESQLLPAARDSIVWSVDRAVASHRIIS